MTNFLIIFYAVTYVLSGILIVIGINVNKLKYVKVLGIIITLIDVLLLFYILDEVNSSNFVLYITSLIGSLVLRVILSNKVRYYYNKKYFSDYINSKFESYVDKFNISMSLLDNGFVANKFSLSDKLKKTFIYEDFIKVRGSLKDKLNLILSERQSITDDAFYFWLLDVLSSGAESSDYVTSKLLFEDNMEFAESSFALFTLQLLHLDNMLGFIMKDKGIS